MPGRSGAMRPVFVTAEDAALSIGDGDTVALTGGGGGLMEATTLFQAIERRFLSTRRPRDLTLVHALGLGDRKALGLNCFAYEGLVRRVIGGYWAWSPRMQQLARDEKIEAYALPGGVISQLFREIGARRPGLFTRIGLGTMCDPRQGGGRMNARAKDALVELVEIDGRELLRYVPFPVDVALVRASAADDDGNVTFAHEAVNLDAAAIALAARACGGKVIVQVGERLPRGSLRAREVRLPAAWVDAIVVDPDQRISYDIAFDPALTGELTGAARLAQPVPAPERFDARQALARRAACELFDGAVVAYGFGAADAVARLVAQRGELGRVFQTIDHGAYGGSLLGGDLFGYARNASAIVDAAEQFDYYAGGNLDVAFLGFGEVDAQGNVNASLIGGMPVGPGALIDIAQNARKVVFCGPFAARGAELETGDGRMRVRRQGEIRKFVREVGQTTFGAAQALAQGQTVLYLTERAAFRLTRQGTELFEIAPGIDLARDVLDQMGFVPRLADPVTVMPASHFRCEDDRFGALSSRPLRDPG